MSTKNMSAEKFKDNFFCRSLKKAHYVNVVLIEDVTRIIDQYLVLFNGRNNQIEHPLRLHIKGGLVFYYTRLVLVYL